MSQPPPDHLLRPRSPWTVRHVAGTGRFRHPDGLRICAFSPDDELICTASADGPPRLWSTTDGEEQARIGGHLLGVRAMAFSPDGSMIATADGRSTLRLVDPATGDPQTRVPSLPGIIDWMAFAGPKRILVYPHRFPSLLVVDLDHDDVIGEIPLRDEGINALRLVPGDGCLWLGAALASGRVTIQKVVGDNISEARVVEAPLRAPVSSLDIDEDGACVFSTWQQVSVVDPGNTQPDRTFDLPVGRLRQVAFAGSRVAVADGHHVRMIDRASGDESSKWVARLTRQTTLTVSPGATLAAFDSDGVARLVSLADGADRTAAAHDPPAHRLEIASLAWSDDGRVVASGPPFAIQMPGERIRYDCDGAITHSVDDLSVLQRVAGARAPVAVAADASRWLCGVFGGEAKVFDCATGDKVCDLELLEPFATSAAFHPDGQTVAVGSSDFRTRLYDATTGELKQIYEGHVGEVMAIAFADHGTQLVTGSRDGTVRIYDIESAEELKAINLRMIVTCLAVSADGTCLLVGCKTGTVVVFALPEIKRLCRLRDLPGSIQSVVASADGEHAHAFLVGSPEEYPMAEWVSFHIRAGAPLPASDPAALALAFGVGDEEADAADETGESLDRMHPERVIASCLPPSADRAVIATDHGRVLVLERNPSPGD